MRRVVVPVLVGLAVFCLLVAILFPTVAVPRAKKTPLNLDVTTRATGTAKILDADTQQYKDVQVRATRFVKTDSTASDGTNTTLVENLCVTIDEGNPPDCVASPDPRLLSITTDRVIQDRKTAEAVHVEKWHEAANGDTSVRHVGLSYKWPIDAKKQTYKFFHPDLVAAADANYLGEDKINGLKVYKYEADTDVHHWNVKGTFPGTFQTVRTVWVEPHTGVIVKGVEHQTQQIKTPTGWQLAIDVTLTFDQKTIDSQAKKAKEGIDQVNLAGRTIPIVAGILGLVLLAGAVLLGRRRQTPPGEGTTVEVPPPPS